MSDDLAIGGPRGTTVVTTELEQEATVLLSIGFDIESCLRSLQRIDAVIGNGLLTVADAPQSAMLAEQEIHHASLAVLSARDQCAHLQRGVANAAIAYEWVERKIAESEEATAALLAYILGTIAPALILLLLPLAVPVAIGYATLSDEERAELGAETQKWWKEKSRYLSDPAVVKAVRLSVTSADDFGLGLFRVPLSIASPLGNESAGLLGVDTSAATLVFAGSAFGLFRETAVRVEQRSQVKGQSNAKTVEDRLERIPSDSSQIRIDRYSRLGMPDRFEVYIGGTQDFSAVSGDQPFDLTSNVSAMSGGSDGSGAASYAAVVEAMRQAGIDSTSAVDFTGYSQGGLIAAQLAASGDYSTGSLLTFGAPAGQVSVPHDIPYLAVEHKDDLVPALGGSFVSSDPLVVRRQVFDELPASSDAPLPAHLLTRYSDTAELIDQSSNAKLLERLRGFWRPEATDVTATFYHAERVTE